MREYRAERQTDEQKDQARKAARALRDALRATADRHPETFDRERRKARRRQGLPA